MLEIQCHNMEIVAELEQYHKKVFVKDYRDTFMRELAIDFLENAEVVAYQSVDQMANVIYWKEYGEVHRN